MGFVDQLYVNLVEQYNHNAVVFDDVTEDVKLTIFEVFVVIVDRIITELSGHLKKCSSFQCLKASLHVLAHRRGAIHLGLLHKG